MILSANKIYFLETASPPDNFFLLYLTYLIHLPGIPESETFNQIDDRESSSKRLLSLFFSNSTKEKNTLKKKPYLQEKLDFPQYQIRRIKCSLCK